MSTTVDEKLDLLGVSSHNRQTGLRCRGYLGTKGIWIGRGEMSIGFSEPTALATDGARRQRIDEATRFITSNLYVGSAVAKALLEGSARDLGLPVAEVADDFIRGIYFD